MHGLMSDRPLLVSAIIAHAALYHRDTEIVSRTVEGAIHRYTYAEAERRSKRLARVLLRLGIKPGDRVGTLAWNTFRHFELYYGISGIGAVCHTINPRLFPEQITWIVEGALKFWIGEDGAEEVIVRAGEGLGERRFVNGERLPIAIAVERSGGGGRRGRDHRSRCAESEIRSIVRGEIGRHAA